jgi:hypothetical protein
VKILLIVALILLFFLWLIAMAGGPEPDNADRYPLTPPALQQWGGHGG